MGRKIEVRHSSQGRVCTKCGRFLPWREFYKDPSGFNGRKNTCISCFNERRLKQEGVVKKRKLANKRYYENNKEATRLRRRLRYLLSKDENFQKSKQKFIELGERNKDFAIQYQVGYLYNVLGVSLGDLKKAYKRFDPEKINIVFLGKTRLKRNRRKLFNKRKFII